MTLEQHKAQILLTTAHVEQWRKERASKAAQIATLQAEIAELDERLSLADRLAAWTSASAVVPKAAPSTEPEMTSERRPLVPWRRREGKEPWGAKLLELIRKAPDGLDARDLRELVSREPEWAERLAASDKGFYHALTRLRQSAHIVTHNGRNYSAANYELAKQSGALETATLTVRYAHSPMGEAILDIIYGHDPEGGILGKNVVKELRTDPEFDATLTPHNSGAYNIIARLIKRKQIAKSADGRYIPGPAMPERDRTSKWLIRYGRGVEPPPLPGVFS